jgi:hypothetical protein
VVHYPFLIAVFFHSIQKKAAVPFDFGTACVSGGFCAVRSGLSGN